MRGLILLVFLSLTAVPAQAARLALVIGIDAYDLLPPLEKAVGDAEAMSAKLGELGFSVRTVLNPDRRQFNEAVTELRTSLAPGDVAFVHFSGHGIEVAGRNLLLPRDMPLPRSGSDDFLIAEAIDLGDLTSRIADSDAAVRIFVIDACRNNPFAQKGVRGLGSAGGLGPVATSRGSFILYSAGYAQTALDRLGPDDQSRTSVYTRVLIDRLGTPGASISDIARGVRVDVAALAETAGHEQSPAYYDELSEDFVLGPPSSDDARPAAASTEAEAFDRARHMGTVGALDAFLDNYPTGVFADLARSAMADIAGRAPLRLDERASPIVDLYAARNRLHALRDEGDRLSNAGDNAEAFLRMSDARVLAGAYFGPHSEEYADASNRIVGALTSVGRLDEAIAASRDAIRIYTTLFGENDMRVLNEKGNLAGRLAVRSNMSEAAALFDELLAAYGELDLHGDHLVAYASVLEGYASLSLRKMDPSGADIYFARAVSILESAGLTSIVNYGYLTANYGRFLRDAGQCQKALLMFSRAAESMNRAGVSTSHDDYAQILQDLGQGCPG